MHTASFEPTEGDLVAASRLRYRMSFKSRRMLAAYLIGAALFAAIGCFLAWGGDTPELIAVAVGWPLVWVITVSLILLLNYMLLPARSRRTFAQQKALHCAVALKWTDAGITLESERGSSSFAWSDFIGCAESPEIILLLQSDYLFNFIPKRALSEAQAASIMARCKL